MKPLSEADKSAAAHPGLELVGTLFTLAQLKETVPDAPQVAMVGRSNVGKSSLLNALARRKKLAKISSTPGKTRSVNLFRVTPDGFYLADLPGYGYAKRGKAERKAWGELIETYLLQTPQMRGVVLLLDCRLPPQESDKLMADFARGHNLPLLPVLTKADKCLQREIAFRRKEWASFLRGVEPQAVSAKSGVGIRELWAMLRQAAVPVAPGAAETATGEAPAEQEV